MSRYSLSRVAQYARYHYVSQSRNYMSLVLTIVAMLAIVGILNRSVITVADVSMAMYLFGTIAQAMRTTYTMRNRATKVLESVVPVSNGERFTFMLFNLAVVFPVTMVLSSIVAMAIVMPFNYADIPFMTALDYMSFYLQWPIYVLVQLLASASLLINLLARRSLFIAYLGAFVGAILFLSITGRVGVELYINNEETFINMLSMPEYVGRILFCSLPVIFYALAYWALCKRQVKW